MGSAQPWAICYWRWYHHVLPFCYFFPSTSGIGPFWTTQTLPPASVSWNRLMILCDLKILDTLQAKYSVMYCSGGKKVTPPIKQYLQWQTTSSKDLGLWHWIFSQLLWKCWWDSQWEGFFIWENRCSKGICLWSLLSQCAPSGLCLLAVGLTSSETLGRRKIWNCLYHLTLHPDNLPSSRASWC